MAITSTRHILVKTKKQADNLKQQLNNVAVLDRLEKSILYANHRLRKADTWESFRLAVC